MKTHIVQIAKDMIVPQKGFTLAEMLIALALIGIIAAILIPKVLESSGERAKIAKARSLISLVERAYYESAMDPEGASQAQNMYEFLLPRINGTPSGAGVAAGGCLQRTNVQGGFEFPDGTAVTFNNGTGATNINAPGAIWICLDLKANSATSAYGDDLFAGSFHYGNPNTPVKFDWNDPASGATEERVGTLLNLN